VVRSRTKDKRSNARVIFQ